jgi:catechol 2,3-dioxygenase-like lactoylglutathione lyase family enzyme
MSIRGLNHVTLAVSDLDRTLGFYRDLLGLELAMHAAHGAYLTAGNLWLCLHHQPEGVTVPDNDYSHIAFDVGAADFPAMAARIAAAAPCWQPNSSEGESLYILDPDGHRLELHVGSLTSRLSHYRRQFPAGMWIADDRR